jgi:hypothetical protein
MAKKRPTPNEQAKLREKLIVQEFLQGRDAEQRTPTRAFVDHVLADEHPHDEPQSLINFAHDAFSHQKMRARLSDDAPVPLADIARECVHADDAKIASWGTRALEDFSWPESSKAFPLSVEQLCVIICLVGLTPHPASHLAAGDELKGRE